MGGSPKINTATEKRMMVAVLAKVILMRPGCTGGGGATTVGETDKSLAFLRSGKSGGKNAKIMTQAESATPMPTREPSCAKPGKPPKFRTTKAVIVVTAAQKMLGAMARRICGTDKSGCASASW